MMRVTFSGRFYAVEDAVLLPSPRRRVPLMVGATGDRMLSIALPYVDAWNTVLRPSDVTPDELTALQAKAAAIP